MRIKIKGTYFFHLKNQLNDEKKFFSWHEIEEDSIQQDCLDFSTLQCGFKRHCNKRLPPIKPIILSSDILKWLVIYLTWLMPKIAVIIIKARLWKIKLKNNCFNLIGITLPAKGYLKVSETLLFFLVKRV